ncbi:M20 family metallopeptidase [Mangrovibacter phragmitis]|uniref:M20 family metallopeptidase n=1 Tax=Mangrovibacter phragmitis TaxID=1691903 RepID=UPI003516AF0D
MTTPLIALSRQLLGFNTINPPGNEHACMAFLASHLEERGFEVSLLPFGENRTNLVARLPGDTQGAPLGFTGHLDTVPLGQQQWQYDPYGKDIVGGRLYGRGSSDMKAAIAAFIGACDAQRAAIRAGTGVTLWLTGGEETGCDGARALLESGLAGTAPGALIVGEPTANYPVIGHKGALWLRAETTGKTAHGAMPELGVNAIYLAADALQKIQHFSPGPDHPLMRHPTLNVGRIHGGLNINSVPDHAVFDVDIRTAPNLSHSDICQRLHHHIGEHIRLEAQVDLPAVLTDPQDPWIQAVFALCQPLHGTPLTPRIVPYFTDASLLLPALGNPPCIILGPGEPAMAHQTDEYCEVNKLEQAQSLYGEIIAGWMKDPMASPA